MRAWKFVLLILLISLLAVPSRAAEHTFSHDYEISKESIGFSDTNTCSGHVYFEQYSVNQNQWFAVYYRYSETNGENTSVFGRAYIDIYNAAGALVKEISFDTTQEIAIEMVEDAVLVYFHTHVMAYTWEDNAICGYEMANYDSVREDIFSNLRRAEIIVGEWTYQSEKALHGYTSLTRNNGSTKQTLVELSGTKFTFQNTVLPGLLVGVVIIIVAVVKRSSTIKKRRGDNTA